jgi:glycosyltransferase involved in cell wall biosynthesis
MNYCVVIPTIGRKSVLKSIESVLNQTIKPKQIVVVLNSNRSRSFIFEKYKSDIQLFFSEKPGVSNARNLGMDQIQEGIEIVAFLDDDDTWLENKMKIQIEFIENQKLSEKDYWLVCSGAYVTYPNMQILKRPKVWLETSIALSNQLYRFSWKRSSVYLPTPSWVIPRKVALEVKFDPNLHNREDVSFLLDIESKSGMILQVNEYLCTVASDKSRVASRENLKNYVSWIVKLGKINFLSALAFAMGTGFKTMVFSTVYKIVYSIRGNKF